MIKVGRYRHDEGKENEMLGCAKHSETEGEFVVSRALQGNSRLWIRPKPMFLEKIEIHGEKVPSQDTSPFLSSQAQSF